MKALVVDASVALKWYLPDEKGVEKALLLHDSFMRDEITLHAPSLIDWEFMSAMWVAGRTGRVAPEDRDAAVGNFLDLENSRVHANQPSLRAGLDNNCHGIRPKLLRFGIHSSVPDHGYAVCHLR